MIIEWLWNQRGFAFPVTSTRTTQAKVTARKGKSSGKTKSKKRK